MQIISGGQTGADRGGLEAGKQIGLQTGGYCPKGWRTDNGPDITLAEFGLVETKSSGYPVRTKANVLLSDGTLIFGNVNSPGSLLTVRLCLQYNKPCKIDPTKAEILEFIASNRIEVLNIAGNRERTNPGIQKRVQEFLVEAPERNCMKHAEVKLHYLNGQVGEYILIEDANDLQVYADYLITLVKQQMIKCIHSPLFPEHIDHMIGNADEGTALLNVAWRLAGMEQLKGSSNSILTNPLYQIEPAAVKKLEIIGRMMAEGSKVLVGSKAGGLMDHRPGRTEIVRVFDRKPGNAAPKDIFVHGARYVVLENDWTVPEETKTHFKAEPFSVILDLRGHDTDELNYSLEQAKQAGAKIVFVYTTGLDVPQMYDYLNAIIKVGLKRVEYLFAGGEIPANAQECLDSFKDKLYIFTN
jgi:hypothetical protein